MNDESLERVNAFLAAASRRVAPGQVLDVTPAEIGRELGFPDALSTARAVRALIARKRMEPAMGSYRLLDDRPVDPGEREAVGRPPRKPRAAPSGPASSPPTTGAPATHTDFGLAMVDRLLELGREVATLRASTRQAREDARAARQDRDEAEQRARGLAERLQALESRAEMAESNLRTLLAAARPKETHGGSKVSDSEMEAILGVLKGADAGAPADVGEAGDS
ncbi:MAG: hypothetical protein ABI572_03575 [Actinomycetota bacterium]